MAHKIFMFVGFVLLATTALLYFTLDGATLRINGRVTTDPNTIGNFKNYLCLGLGALGAFFAGIGVKGQAAAKKQAARNVYILQNGIETQGNITFVDKNYTLLINNAPVYSIVEYTYQDRNGNQHTRRINNIPSEIVIRKQIQVGGTIPVKYAPENSAESVMVII